MTAHFLSPAMSASAHPLFISWKKACAVVALCAAMTACQRSEPPAAPVTPPAPVTNDAPAIRSKEQAQAALLALPELQEWSQQIAKSSGGKAHGAVIEDNPQPRELDGKRYYQMSFVEDREGNIRRRESFLVAHQGDDILVDDVDTDTLLSLQEWRRTIQKVQLGGAR